MRKITIPGEVLASGEDYLPGEGTEKRGNDVIAVRYGLLEETNKLFKVIPLSGVYSPRRGNVVIGRVENITFNGWVMDIGTPQTAFIPISETPRYVDKNGLDEVLDIGDMVVAKINEITKRGVDLTIKMRGLGRIEKGITFEINSNKVPRVIGKEGSMISVIKNETGCEITVGQNGIIWIQGKNVEDELFAKKSILFIVEKSFVDGLTEEVKNWFEKNRKGK